MDFFQVILQKINWFQLVVEALLTTVIIGPLFAFVLLRLEELFRRRRPLAKLLGQAAKNDQDCYIFLGSYQTIRYQKDEIILAPFAKYSDVIGESKEIFGPLWNIGEGDGIALSYVQAILGLAGKQRGITVERDSYGLKNWDCNSFCIGAANIKTQHSLALLKPFYTFSENFKEIELVENPSHKWHINKEKGKDYAMLMKLTNQFCKDKVVFIIAGLGEIATPAAAYYLWSNWKQLVNEFKDKPFGCIIEVDIHGNYQTAEKIHSISNQTGFFAMLHRKLDKLNPFLTRSASAETKEQRPTFPEDSRESSTPHTLSTMPLNPMSVSASYFVDPADDNKSYYHQGIVRKIDYEPTRQIDSTSSASAGTASHMTNQENK